MLCLPSPFNCFSGVTNDAFCIDNLLYCTYPFIYTFNHNPYNNLNKFTLSHIDIIGNTSLIVNS